MLWWTYTAALACPLVSWFIASGDKDIIDACGQMGLACIETHGNHASGTDRVAEAALRLSVPYIINLQADEPTIDVESLIALSETMMVQQAPLTTLIGSIASQSQWADENCVKAFVDDYGSAQDFVRGPQARLEQLTNTHGRPHTHIGVYGFTRHALENFTSMAESPRERSERLEQLRALEAGWTIKTAQTSWTPIGVDTPQDAVTANDI